MLLFLAKKSVHQYQALGRRFKDILKIHCCVVCLWSCCAYKAHLVEKRRDDSNVVTGIKNGVASSSS